MNLKIVLSTASALALLAGAAWAEGDNQAKVKQSGQANTALIDQSQGDHGFVGTFTDHTYGNVTQTGSDNSLDVTQKGSGNNIAYWYGDSANNVTQDGVRNSITILQKTNDHPFGGNAIRGIDQDSIYGTEVTNKLVIRQDNGSGGWATNRIGFVKQNNTGNNVNSATYSNTIDIRQSGGVTDAPPGGNYLYRSNFIASSTQDNGYGNSQDIDQVGTSNYIGTVNQNGLYNAATIDMNGDQNAVTQVTQTNTSGIGNTAVVRLHGNQNGTGIGGSVTVPAPWGYPTAAVASFDLDSNAEWVGVGQSTVSQKGAGGNILRYTAAGNYNLFGFSQDGSGNGISGTADDSNQIAVSQKGAGNQTAFTQSGDGNNAGVKVNGDGNFADVFQYDGNKSARISVGNGDSAGANLPITHSDNNRLRIQQNGGSNTASLLVDGSRNKADVRQSAGSGNTFALNITGNLNNGAADFTAGSDANSIGGLTVGLFKQVGTENDFSVKVNGNNNQLASLQSGEENHISGSVNGNNNEAAIRQSGGNNYVLANQTGNGNNIGISQ